MKRLIAAVLAATMLMPAAMAQNVSVPIATHLSPGDAFGYAYDGIGRAAARYATPGMISGMIAYVNGGAVSTAWTYTFAPGVTLYFITPAGTLATGTLTMPASPGDGQTVCFESTQTQTAITPTANTGQTMSSVNPVTAGVAGTTYCWWYQASSATWYRNR